MRALLEIVKKNCKLLLRSKSSALIIILGPMIVIFLLGVAFDNSNLFALNLGVYSEDYNDLSNEFISKLEQQEYSVQKIENEEICVQKIQEGILHACIIFPKDLSIEKKELSNEITFYVDHSKINLIYVVIETLTNKISMQSEELSLNLTNILLEQLEKTRVEVFTIKPLISEMKGDIDSTLESATGVKSSFEGLDLKFDAELAGAAQLSKALGTGFNGDRIITELESIREDINSAQEDAAEAGEQQIAFILSGVKADITTLKSNITTSSGVDLNALVDKIQNNLALAENKINAASSVRDSSNELISSVREKLEATRTNIDKIDSSFNNIDGYIGSIQVNNAEDIVNPINTKIKAVSSDKTHLNFLFPSLMVLVVMFLSIMLSTTLVMMERKSPAYFRNFITPVRDIIFLIGTTVTSVLFVLIQILIIIGISIIFFSSEMLPVLSVVIPMLLLITLLFTFIGMAIGYVFNSEETSTLAAISIASLLLLLSDLIIPLETMPKGIANIAQYSPFIISESILKKLIIFQSSFSLYATDFWLILTYTLLCFGILVIIRKVTKQNFIIEVSHRIRRLKALSQRKKKEEEYLMKKKEYGFVKEEVAINKKSLKKKSSKKQKIKKKKQSSR